jgi:O-antigen ligase
MRLNYIKNINQGITDLVNNSKLYLLFVTLITIISLTLSTYLDLNINSYIITYSPLIVITIIIGLYSTDTFTYVPILINALLLTEVNNMNFNNIPNFIIIFATIYLLSLLIFIIKNKINIFKGKLRWSYFTVFLVLILVSFHLPANAPKYLYLYILVFPLYYFLYLFFSSTFKQDQRYIVAASLMNAGLLCFIQTLIYIINTPYEILMNQISNGISYTIPWANANIGAIFLNITIGATFALIAIFPKHHEYKIIAILEIFALLLTVSRAGIIIFAISGIAYLVLLFKYRPNNKYYIVNLLIILLLVTIIFIFFIIEIFSLFINILNSFLSSDTTSGRISLIKESINDFKQNPIFGNGAFGKLDEFESIQNGVIVIQYAIFSYHSMPFQILAISGLIGIIAVIYNHIDIFRLLFKQTDIFNSFMIVIFISTTIYSLGDNVYLEPHYMVLSFIILSTIENANPTKNHHLMSV